MTKKGQAALGDWLGGPASMGTGGVEMEREPGKESPSMPQEGKTFRLVQHVPGGHGGIRSNCMRWGG